MKKTIALVTALAFSIIVIGAQSTTTHAAADTIGTPQYTYVKCWSLPHWKNTLRDVS